MRAARLAGLCLLCCLVGLPAAARAGQLQVQISAQAALDTGGVLRLRATATNLGDDPALRIMALALRPSGGQPAGPLEILPPGHSVPLELTQGMAPSAPGRHAAVLRLDLHDQRMLPFSALGHAYYVVGRDQASPLLIQAEPLELAERGLLRCSLRNASDRPVSARFSVHAPRELSVTPEQASLELAAGQVASLELTVINQGGQPGAQYPLLLVSSCDVDGLLSEDVREARVVILAPPNPFRQHLAWWLALIAGLAAWLAAAQIRRGGRRP